jgi:hypothetical protein
VRASDCSILLLSTLTMASVQQQLDEATAKLANMSLIELKLANEFLSMPKKERTSLVKDAGQLAR